MDLARRAALRPASSRGGLPRHSGHRALVWDDGAERSGWGAVHLRAKKVLEPGFHPLLPLVQQVRHLPVRSVALDLPRQRIMSADGLVYHVHTHIVYRVENPIPATTAIDNLGKGVLTLVPLLVRDLLRAQTRETLVTREVLEQDLTARGRQALARWGLTVEQVGLSTIAPTKETARLTQLPARVAEGARVLEEQQSQGVAGMWRLLWLPREMRRWAIPRRAIIGAGSPARA